MADMLVRPNGTRRFLGDFLGVDPFRGAPPVAGYGFEINKTEAGYVVELPVPGYKADQIDVTVEDRVLTIGGRTDRRQFSRALMLPEEIDADAIEAKVEHGMLTLNLSLLAKAQPRKIDVKFVN